MKSRVAMIAIWLGLGLMASAAVTIDEWVFGDSLGGWRKYSEKYAQYTVSGTKYRTYRPESTITPDGGMYLSVRIDHVRGWFSSDDHAVLEITVDQHGAITSAQSNIAIQGRSISSDVILGVNKVGSKAPGIDSAVQIGTDLVANLSSKLLRQKIIEPGRVSFPSAVRHNYNLLYQAIRVDGVGLADIPEPIPPAAESSSEKDEPVVSHKAAPLQIKSYSDGTAVSVPPKKK